MLDVAAIIVILALAPLAWQAVREAGDAAAELGPPVIALVTLAALGAAGAHLAGASLHDGVAVGLIAYTAALFVLRR